MDLLLEEIMHTLILAPLTPRLRETLGKHLMTAGTNNPRPSSPMPKSWPEEDRILLSQQTKNAFRDCLVRMRSSVSPLDKLAHLLTALKVLINAVSRV